MTILNGVLFPFIDGSVLSTIYQSASTAVSSTGLVSLNVSSLTAKPVATGIAI